MTNHSRAMPFVPLDGKHPELEAELKHEKQERMIEMGTNVVSKYLDRF
ncbi:MULTISPECIES: hypothetical protein [unclassified Leisingera]|nr:MULTISPECIES: hypothetical protein [unclassified Leisingera]